MLNVDPMSRRPNRSGILRIDRLSEFIENEERLRFIAEELSHRTKNLLAVVQAIANQIGRRSESQKDFQSQFSQRLQGLSRSIDLLVEEDGRGASIADLVRSHLEPFGEVDGMRISATGPSVLLNPEAAQNIGLALHELATNAIKHGALSVPEGLVTVEWELEAADVGPALFRLIWIERNGPKVTPPTHQGFGHIVLQRMTAATLQGHVSHEFDSRGVSWTLEVPAAAAIVGAAAVQKRDWRVSKSKPPVIRAVRAKGARYLSLSKGPVM
jgi:two-component sensor histidine kinase